VEEKMKEIEEMKAEKLLIKLKDYGVCIIDGQEEYVMEILKNAFLSGVLHGIEKMEKEVLKR
jgi:hypothetical protein